MNVALYDVSLKTDRQAYGRVLSADLTFFNAAGAILAQGEIREPYGVVSISHPEVGDCSRYERQAATDSGARQEWQRCFEALSRWQMQWVREVRYATVSFGKCRIEKLPVLLTEYQDAWWMWWVPFPHVGGTPYTSFELSLRVDGLNCRAAGP